MKFVEDHSPGFPSSRRPPAHAAVWSTASTRSSWPIAPPARRACREYYAPPRQALGAPSSRLRRGGIAARL